MAKYLNEKTNQSCIIIEYTTASAPYCLVEYASGIRKTEHFADLKRMRVKKVGVKVTK